MRSSKGASVRPFLTLTNATFRLGERLVFENTTWTFGRDEHWAVLGGNGSGKSLFGDALRGKLPLVGGELVYHFDCADGCAAEECIGHIAFEDRKTVLHGTIVQSRWNSIEEHQTSTVREFLSYDRVMDVNPYEVSGHRAARASFARRSRHAIKLMQVDGFLDRELLSLSNGETQRVHLARALSLPLRLLILDDPFTGLDPASRDFLRRVFQKLLRTSVRLLFISAKADDLPEGITNVLLLKDCRVLAAGPKNELVQVRHRIGHDRGSQILPGKYRACSDVTGGRGEVLLEFKDVTVRYGPQTILNRINWKIHSGESWALLGPNGSGKTTLLSLILADNPQVYANEVTVFGKRVGAGESVWERKSRIGWVSPELHLHFDDSITCMESVLSGFHNTIGLFEPVSRAQRRAAQEWLARFELRGFANSPLFSLSLGLQRMVLLARALVKAPKLLILDEPCQGLDEAHRDLFIETLDELISLGRETAIYVTHRPEEIPASIKQVLRLEKGRVV